MLAATPPLLEKVLRKFRTGEMPPAGMPRPAAPVAAAFTKILEDVPRPCAAAHPNPGRPAVHRLNRAEYSNAIRDVLALDIQPGSALPVDDSGYGFDNIGDVLSISPALLEKYMSVARMVSRLAVGNTNIKPTVEELSGAPRRSGRRRPPTQRAGERRSALRFARRLCAALLLPGGCRIRHPRAGQGGGGGGGGDRKWEIRQPVAAGLRTIGVTFLRESAKPEMALLPADAARWPRSRRCRRRRQGIVADGGIGSAAGWREAEAVSKFRQGKNPPQATGVTISGPYNITGPGDTPEPRAESSCAARPTARTKNPARARFWPAWRAAPSAGR